MAERYRRAEPRACVRGGKTASGNFFRSGWKPRQENGAQVAQLHQEKLDCGDEMCARPRYTCEERDASNNVTKRFYAQGEQIGGTNYFFTRDHLGSIREMTNASGALVARYDYDPFGRRTLVSGADLADFGFQGMYYHAPSGLYVTAFRFYDPVLGRFATRDPIGENGGINLYRFVANNPINLVDPWGLCPGDRQKCMEQYLRSNYGNFVADKIIANFGLGSFLPSSGHLGDAIKTSVEALAVKGGFIAGLGALGNFLFHRGTTIMFQPASNYAKYGGLAARAAASESSMATGAAIRTAAGVGAEVVAVAGAGLTAFGSMAQFLAYMHCRGVSN